MGGFKKFLFIRDDVNGFEEGAAVLQLISADSLKKACNSGNHIYQGPQDFLFLFFFNNISHKTLKYPLNTIRNKVQSELQET